MQKRASNLELLRIVAMLLIVLSHCSVHGIGSELPEGLVNPLAIYNYCGNLGVNLFVMITGYFMVTSKFSLGKLLKLLLQILVCSVLLYLFECVVVHPQKEISLADVKDVCFSVKYYKWWFISTYVQLFLLAPFLNVLLTSGNPRRIFAFIGASVMIILYFRTHNFPLLLFLNLYALGAWVRLYLPESAKLSEKSCFAVAGGLLLMYTGILYMCHHLVPNMHFVKLVQLSITSSYSVPVMFLSLVLFVGFVKWQIPYNRLINTVAATTLGIYLIHDCPGLRYYIWRTILHVDECVGKPYEYGYYLLSVAAVFIVCSAIEWGRGMLFNKPTALLVDRLLLPVAERVQQGAKRMLKW